MDCGEEDVVGAGRTVCASRRSVWRSLGRLASMVGVSSEFRAFRVSRSPLRVRVPPLLAASRLVVPLCGNVAIM